MKFKSFIDVFVERFLSTNTTTWAASLAFYTSLSLAPLLILFVTFSSRLSPDLQNTFVSEATYMMGPQAASTVEMIIMNAKSRSDLSSISGMVGMATLLLSASFIFGELRSALNQIFEVKNLPKQLTTFLSATQAFIKVYIFQMGFAFAFLFIMIVSLVISTALSAILYSDDAAFKAFINIAISILFYSALFTLLFHFVPSERLTWRRSWQAGLMTSLLFVGGKELIGLYLGNSGISTSYGAAGSLVVLLAWVYYSALIIFIGAHCATTLAILSKKASESVAHTKFVPLKEPHEV
ncbi:MAG: YihY/virulence factor BrkB family protein [Bdellovibrio sp.]|nr:YihY/virulence factor BrkB family protein [Bdellovibrio sp.]